MTMNIHPTSGEFEIAATRSDQATSTLEHVEGCVACRVRLARVRRELGFEPPDGDSVQRIIEASTPLPDGLGDLVQAERQGDPQPGEIWRIGCDEALLVWTRRVFDDGVADVVPLVLDIELADQETVLVDADVTPLGSELAAMVALRTHIDIGAFLNRIGDLDIHKDVAEVMAAAREGRWSSGVRVGSPIDDDDDQRIEYRQALRDLLSEFMPSAWAMAHPAKTPAIEAGQRVEDHPPDDLAAVKSRLGERIDGLQFRSAEEQVIVLERGIRVRAVMKVDCLDTTVLVVTIDAGISTTAEVAAACEKMVERENDADAVAVATPEDEWATLLFTRPHLRNAIELPSGVSVGPKVTLEGYDLVDILAKYFEGVTTPWDVTEPVTESLVQRNLRQIAAEHAKAAIELVSQAGQRAHQPAKKVAWQQLPTELADQVARFVDAVANEKPVHEALDELGLGEPQ